MEEEKIVMITPERLNKMKCYLRDNLRSIRLQEGLSRNKFSNKIGLSHSAVKRIEDGNLPIMLTTYKIMDALKLQPDIILGK
jgi:transcriptional regulator with XRE-family HTH domain